MVRVADLVVTYCQFELRVGEGLPTHYGHYGEHTHAGSVSSLCVYICARISVPL